MSITYGSTRTTLYTTTITAPTRAASVSIYYPWPAITNAPEFVTVTRSGGVQDTLPVLVLTDVVGIVVSANGQPLTTGTLVQADSASATAAAKANAKNEDCSTKWHCWSSGEQAGVIFGAIISVLALLAVVIWAFCCISKKKGKTEKDIESGGTKNKKMAFGWAAWPSRGRKTLSETSSNSSGSPRRSRVIEIPPNGPHSGGVPTYAVVAEPSPREAFRRAVELHPDASLPGSKTSSRGLASIPHERRTTPPSIHSPSPHRAWKYKPAHNSQYSARDSVRTQIDHPPPSDGIPSDTGACIDTKHLSQRSSYYRPRVRDFAVPAAVLAGAGVAAAAGSKRVRASSLQTRPPGKKEERKSRSRGPESTSRRRGQEKLPEDGRSRETRERSRERWEMRRERDARRNGPPGREVEARRESRGRDLPAEREERRAKRERKARSASPPRTNTEKVPQKKRQSMGGQAKWLALLPLALRAIHVLTEPDGGWEQYHSNKKDKDKGRQRRAARNSSSSAPENSRRRHSVSAEDRRSRPSRAPTNNITINNLADGEIRSRPRRATFSNPVTREPSPRNESSRKHEEPRRRRSNREDARARRNRRNVGHDGAMSSDSEDYHHPQFIDEEDEDPLVIGRRRSRRQHHNSSS